MNKKGDKVFLAENEKVLITLLCTQKITAIKESGENGPIIEAYLDRLERIINKVAFEPIKNKIGE